MIRHSIIKRVMLFALTLWVLQVSTAFSSTGFVNASDDVLIQTTDTLHQSVTLSSSVDLKDCQSEQHLVCDTEHCASCLFVIVPASNDLTVVINATRHINLFTNSLQQYPSNFYRPPQNS